MRRYLRLYLYFLRFSFSRAMEFRLDFFFRIIMDCTFYAVHLVFFGLLYRHTQTMGLWNLDQALIFVTAFFFIDALHMTVFSNNLWMFPQLVNQGDLDYYLVRPVSALFFVSLRDFAANSFMNLVIASGLLVWALWRYPEELGAGTIALFVIFLIAGGFLYYAMYMTFMIPVFWIHRSEGLRQFFFGIEQFSERPDQIFTGWLRRLLVSVLPFAIVASFPTHLLFEGPSGFRWLHMVIVLVGSFGVLQLFWRWGLRSYVSASS